MKVMNVLDRAKSWLNTFYDETTRAEVQKMIDANDDDLQDAFYKDLEFGTGGLRGLLGAGTNRVNKYTIGKATQGLAHFLNKKYQGEIKVCIAYDSRNFSKEFAYLSAGILNANGIKTLVFNELRPTPLLSFAIRKAKAQAGIVITASHNPKEYNGYKVYAEDGGQIVPPNDKLIINEVNNTAWEQIRFAEVNDLHDENTKFIEEAYLEQCIGELNPKLSAKDRAQVKVLYTPIHGTGVTVIPELFKRAGFTQAETLISQSEPNGDFPTVVYPNPEEQEAMSMGLRRAEEIGADLLLGTDPDTDRVGIAVRNEKGEMELLNGNQTAALLVYYVLQNKKENKDLLTHDYICKTIVTTDLLADIAKKFGVTCYETLTGFKWIAEQIELRKDERYLVGGEESYGYLIGNEVRDKDAAMSALVIADLCAYARKEGKSLWEMLMHIFQEFGFYQEFLKSITRKGKKGAEEIKAMMDTFRNNTPDQLGDYQVLAVADYQSGELKFKDGKIEKLTLPSSNVIQFHVEGGGKITARPSGTEPKIKFYCSLKSELKNPLDFRKKQSELLADIEKIISSLEI